MKCQELNHLLDSSPSDARERAQREAIHLHLATCSACGEDWANWGELAALPVPATPATLARHIAMAAKTRLAPQARRSSRSVIIGCICIVTAAAAAALLLQFDRQDPGHRAVQSAASTPQPMDKSYDQRDPSQQQGSDTALSPESAAPGWQSGARGIPLDPRSIIVLKRPEAAADEQAIVLADQCHDALVAHLRAITDVRLITGGAMSREAAFPYPLPAADQQIGRAHGAGHVLTVSTENGCRATLYDTQSGMPNGGGMNGQAFPPDDGWDRFARSMVQSMRDRALADPAAASTDARATLLDAALGEAARVDALRKLASASRQTDADTNRRIFDKDVVAASIAIATASSNSQVRESIWASLRDVQDEQLVAPLLRALAEDPDARTRMQAAFSLHDYLDEPGVGAALQKAATQDPDATAEMVCCILTVREAAERASIPDAQLHSWARKKLLDADLPARSRLMALGAGTPDGRFVQSLTQVGGDAPAIVFDIGRREQSAPVRRMAWEVLQRAKPDPTYVSVLLGDLNNHPDEYVRAAAAGVLVQQADLPQVREALERAAEDPSTSVRRAVSRAISSPMP